MRLLVGLIARALVWAAFALIVGDALITLWDRGEYALAVAAAILFPITIFLWPWTHQAFGHPLWWAFVIAAVAYPISTFVGGLPPIDRPGDF